MSPTPLPQPGDVWRRRDDGRLVVIASVDEQSIVALEPDAQRQVRFAPAPFGRIHAHAGLTLNAGPHGAPTTMEASALRGLQQRPTTWLRALIAQARRDGHHELVALAGEVLALRGENPATQETV